jgi:hypothetical protein
MKNIGMSLPGQGSTGHGESGPGGAVPEARAVRPGTYDRPNYEVMGKTWEVQP